MKGLITLENKQKEEIFNNISSAMRIFAEKIVELYSTINWEKAAKNLINIIKVLEPTDEEKDKAIKKLECWGNFGWGIIDLKAVEMYKFQPNNMIEADSIALNFCGQEVIEQILVSLSANVKDKSSFDMAKNCYDQEIYLPCAMLLFAQIDSILIKLQKIENNKYRKTGEKAANILREKVEEDQSQWFLSYGIAYATLNAIIKIYENGNDFSNENPDLINRNFVLHGMNVRKVNKTDCIKLFIILNNLLGIIQTFDFKFES